jgi:hypothetical protein
MARPSAVAGRLNGTLVSMYLRVVGGAQYPLPDHIDPHLWFVGSCGKRDYLVETNPHTFPGRMSAFCPHCPPEQASYNVSLKDLGECSAEAQIWSRGFVAGNEPHVPLDRRGSELEDDTPEHAAWEQARAAYLKSGEWPVDAPHR